MLTMKLDGSAMKLQHQAPDAAWAGGLRPGANLGVELEQLSVESRIGPSPKRLDGSLA